ncbi:Glu/Leu/Phe/Val dehydrogenase dimerization domain-containing protein [Geobacter argillaceus]|uniref:Glu/Leu/Phe/Val dehydrogenase-like protein n=1 Tax=Geobacter argillaceus TaxID=345631 RepID=A0A562VK34_9BACT|nr:Glu/Leu/Phe/Val dehydrogenase dimerization domain-containing protein [Geobacter argillaceus]TWJ18250.1 Glu/Leu/Phe/Val dehydrogenase-like protein [Geobacter argillaceus]
MDEISYDNIGPTKVIRLYSAKEQLRAVVVIDNTALGPAIGGVRVSPTVDVTEVWRLARTMTLKNSIGGLPLDTLGATGFGLAECAEVAAPLAGIELADARVAAEAIARERVLKAMGYRDY